MQEANKDYGTYQKIRVEGFHNTAEVNHVWATAAADMLQEAEEMPCKP